MESVSKVLWEEFGMDPNVLGWAVLSDDGTVVESTFEDLSTLRRITNAAKELAEIGRRAIIDGFIGKIAIVKLKEGFLVVQFSNVVQMGYTLIKTMRIMDKIGIAEKEAPEIVEEVEEKSSTEDLLKMIPVRSSKFYDLFSSELPEPFKEFEEDATDVFLMINDKFSIEEIINKLSHIPREQIIKIILKAKEEGYVSLKKAE
ncbi:MAG: hypothetical protein ACTSV7_11950 [Candidatus Baldrarchaeia archaeon]